jgi:hypothetical protein
LPLFRWAAGTKLVIPAAKRRHHARRMLNHLGAAAGALALALIVLAPASAKCGFWDLGCVSDDFCTKPDAELTRYEIGICKAALERYRAEDARRAALPHHDPGAIELCPKPRKMTNDGCK